jgi:acetyltransferase-like isoleucine patch superfamily enzyme
MKIKTLYEVVLEGFKGLRMTFFSSRKDRYGYLSKTSIVRTPVWGGKQNVYIYENCGINAGAKFICQTGKFIMKRNCSVGPNLTVITCNHKYNKVGQRPESNTWGELEPNDVIVNEDVWIGANVTLCPGTLIGKGCIIAAGSVCIKGKEYPPYSIIGGNPATFIKFRLSLDDQIKQEELFYQSTGRINKDLLLNNYMNLKQKHV